MRRPDHRCDVESRNPLPLLARACIAGYQVSYAIPLVLRVIYRDTFVPGAFHLGVLSLPIHIIA